MRKQLALQIENEAIAGDPGPVAAQIAGDRLQSRKAAAIRCSVPRACLEAVAANPVRWHKFDASAVNYPADSVQLSAAKPADTSTMYLKASGKASGRVNLPTPVSAEPTTIARCGLTIDKNRTSGEREILTSFESHRATNLRSCAHNLPRLALNHSNGYACHSVRAHFDEILAIDPESIASHPESAFAPDRRSLTDIEIRPCRWRSSYA